MTGGRRCTTMPAMEQLRTLRAEELRAAIADVELAFGGAPHELDTALDLSVLDPARCLGVLEDGHAVATAASFAFSMTVPGAVLPVAGVTWVSVAPTHRRRGLLTSTMTRLLADLRVEGTAVAALWATEGAIYQRFGFGPAAWHTAFELPARAPFGREVDTSGLRLVEAAGSLLATSYDEVAARTPGWWVRNDAWWGHRLHDPEHRRDGASPLRCVVDGTDGYALYATKGSWGDAGPDGTVFVREVVARTPDASARLWRYLLDQDLMKTVRAWGRPGDEPLLHLLAEPRSARTRISDGLWVRLVSVPDALAGRRYACPVDVVLEVDDDRCPWNAGRWRLVGGPDGATCTRTDEDADLVMGVRELGAVYLGGTSLTARSRAGWVRELVPGALATATTAFGWPGPAPSSPMVF